MVLRTRWQGRGVMGTTDGLLGLVDGVNDAGLAVSLTFGGRREVGDGFGVPLILRYVLQTCETAKEAEAALSRIPCHMSYNVTVLDAQRQFLTAYLTPDRPRGHHPRRRWPPTTRSASNGPATPASPPRSSASASSSSA